MCSLLGDSAAGNDDNLIGILDGGKTVRDNERRSALAECVKRLLDENFRRVVKRARRFVQNQDRRFFKNTRAIDSLCF